jgi:phosphohistidine swiveling domain-containing protein
LGEDLNVDALSKSLPGNVTSELGLMMGDLAGVARMHPDVVRYLEGAKESAFYQGLSELEGGDVFKAELDRFMDRYGMICPGEISAGVAEGHVKLVLRPEEANLKKGDALVAPFTDPGWTPLFQSARALVVDVGGTMTHGSVIAREYGIPAVVGIENVTRILKDGQRVRVDGTRSFAQMLNENQLS